MYHLHRPLKETVWLCGIVWIVKGVSMNNLNDPPGWNIRPDQRDGRDGNKWNYALLVPMLGLAAFRWIWTRESRRQIQEVKDRYDQDMKSITKDLEGKYKEALMENRRTAVHLELELEKERNRVQGYRQALVSQSQQLLEERKQLQRDRESLEAEKARLLKLGPVAELFQSILEQEKDWEQRAMAVLKEFENGLVERQRAYCSILLPRERRLEMEKNLLIKAAKEPLVTELNMEADLKDIFKNDRHCADLMNVDKLKNGRLMWLYLRYWQLQVTLQKYKRAEEALVKARSNQK
ncbi:coiled-coil domain containing 127a-like [Arapaima gigas]